MWRISSLVVLISPSCGVSGRLCLNMVAFPRSVHLCFCLCIRQGEQIIFDNFFMLHTDCLQ